MQETSPQHAPSTVHATERDTPTARQRRDEIVEAAAAVIAEVGLHKLSLARIEDRIQMSRGQLTYYFATKESILLAVFDRMLNAMMIHGKAEAERAGLAVVGPGIAWQLMQHCLKQVLLGQGTVRDRSQMNALIHTFLAQISYRDDYREKLASANRSWREHLTNDIAASLPARSTMPPAAIASVFMSLLTGLSGQLEVDPQAFDREQTLELCLNLLRPLFGEQP